MKRRLLLTCFLLAISAALVAAQTLPTPSPTPTPSISRVIGLDVFVRGGPGRQYLPVGKLVLADPVTPLSRNVEADWVLITYNAGYGWVRRDLVAWAENIDALPVMDEGNLTPSPGAPDAPQQTLIFVPTDTPVGNWVQLVDAPSGYVRAGPGRTYLRLGQLMTGDVVEPVGRDAETVWIMIRFQGGFGWVRRDLVRWVDDLTRLPVLSPDNLTPTPTFTPTHTPTLTWTPSSTPTATPTSTITPSSTPTSSATSTPTLTPSLTFTATASPTLTSTATYTPIPTNTALPTSTFTALPTFTPIPSLTATLRPTDTALPTATLTDEPVAQLLVATETDQPPPTMTPSPTSSRTPTNLPTATIVPASLTPAPIATEILPSATPIAPTLAASLTAIPATNTLIPTLEQPTVTPTAISTVSPSPTPAPALAQMPTTPPAVTPVPEQSLPGDGAPPVEAIIGGLALSLVILYIALYWRGLAVAERYATGFVVHHCPACDRGELIVEIRSDRLLGIPRPRRTVRCTECRSVLREVGYRRWRYAVDPMENAALYKHYNGREIDDATLVEIARQPHTSATLPAQPRPPMRPPAFTDDDR